jgi:eukaryotic-like serine/threonine-protein kinase
MTLSPGTRLGPYEIQAAIGAGGMGEVYKARDTRLDRSVAIKVLPPEFSADPDRRARFEREAKTIAGLSHPHICTLHDVGEHDGSTYLVMEHLQGETLADRLMKGPLPLEQALTVATEIADALAAAHRQGVIHRDLKPGNVMLTKTGAKLLDFGLAKLTGRGEQAAAASLGSVPTQTRPLTSEGAIVGTLQYMAPEQLEGKEADARTDLWALGAILYEMLTGKRAFEGTSAASLIGHIMSSEPPALSALRPLTPPVLERLVRQCLAKAPDDRPDSAHDVANNLRWLASGPAISESASQADVRALTSVTVRVRFWKTAVLVLVLLVAGMAGAIGYSRWRVRPASAIVRSTIELPAGVQVTMGSTERFPTRTEFALSPDGRHLAFSAVPVETASPPRLYLRSLDRGEAESIKGTEGARQPFFSPDGNWVGFYANGKLYKVSLGGGLAQELATCSSLPKGISWGDDGKIYWGEGGIKRVPAGGGTVEQVTKVHRDNESSHNLTAVLPGGTAVVFTVMPDLWGDRAHVEVASLPAGTRQTLIEEAADARYLSTGHLVFMRRGALMAAAFDPRRLTLTGPPITVVPGVEQALNAYNGNNQSGAGQFSVSASGSLAYASGGIDHLSQCEVVLVGRDGRTEVLPGFEKPEVTNQVRLSPDGKRLAFVQASGPLWLFDLARATHTRVSPEGVAGFPRWSPDGRQLAFAWSAGGRWKIWQVSPEASDRLAPLLEGFSGPTLSSWSRDGRFIAVLSSNPDTGAGFGIWDTRERKLIPFLNGRASDWCPEFSPDGNWLAYSSNETGRREVYLRSFPDGIRKIPVSSQGGNEPAFSADGRELFFLSSTSSSGPNPAKMMTVDIALAATPVVGVPKPLFDFEFLRSDSARGYDLHSDGRRFICTRVKQRATPVEITRINLIQNWFEELKAKVPTK